MNIHEKVKKLLALRAKVNSIKELLDPIQADRDALQADIIKHMTRQGFNSVKTESATVSKAVRKTMKIINEKELIRELENKGLKNEYVKEQVDRDLWRGLSVEFIKSNKTIKGTEIQTTEFISIRATKKQLVLSGQGS